MLKIARYTLDNWASLHEYSVMDTARTELKTLNSQFAFFMKQKTAAKTNLIALLDMTYPGVNKLFTSPVRPDGSEWVDYADSFWHVDCVLDSGPKVFAERYQSFCKHHGYVTSLPVRKLTLRQRSWFRLFQRIRSTKR